MAGGVFAIAAAAHVDPREVLKKAFQGIFYLQHRGPQYCGFSRTEKGEFKNRTHRGLIRPTFANDLGGLEGHHILAHASLETRQPLHLVSRLGPASFAFSGNVQNRRDLRSGLIANCHSFTEDSDIEVLARLIGHGQDWLSGIQSMSDRVEGSFSLVILTQHDGLIAVRDPFGHKPLIIGQQDGMVMVASEKISMINAGFVVVKDVEPGEIIQIKDGEFQTIGHLPAAGHHQHCAFEWIYTANVASTIEGRSVAIVRQEIGRRLSQLFPVEVDLAMGIPNSGLYYAIGWAAATGTPFGMGFMRYDYAGRSYTAPDQAARDFEAELKLVPIEEVVRGKRLVVTDDSIVRGTQLQFKVHQLFACGAKEVHLRIGCPPLLAPCDRDVSTRKPGELAVTKWGNEAGICRGIGATSLHYMPLAEMAQAIGFAPDDLCTHCWQAV